jgi:hypothetical protein
MSKTICVFCFILFSVIMPAEGKVLSNPDDLDFNNVVKAINFGNTTDQIIRGVTFYAAAANSTANGVKNRAKGSVGVGYAGQTLPNIGSGSDKDALEQILGSSIFGLSGTVEATGSSSTLSVSESIIIDVDVTNGYYKVQLIIYDGWESQGASARDVNHTIEGTLAATHYHDFAEQNNTPDAGSVASYVFEVIDGQINLTVEGLVPSAHLSGLVINKLPSLNAVDLKPGDNVVQYDIGASRRNALMNSLAPEIRQQYLTLEDHLMKRSTFDKVAKQTLRQEALILETDRDPVDVVLRRTGALLADIQKLKEALDMSALAAELKKLHQEAAKQNDLKTPHRMEIYAKTCNLRRRIAFSNPLLKDINDIVFIKRHGSLYSHMLDQFYGITAQPGGGLYVLSDPFGENPTVRDVLENAVVQSGALTGQTLSGGPSKWWDIGYFDGDQSNEASLRGEETQGGAFLSPELSFDGQQILFAYAECQGDRTHQTHMDHAVGHWDEQRVYNIFKVNVDGSGLEQLTDGTFNDFDPCWLPNGRIAFISERCGGYIRCGRICPTYLLYDMAADGSDIRRLSYHETSEWQPSVSNDGKILYTRWDYVDRWSSAAHMGWITTPDGRDPREIHGNTIDRMKRPDMEMDIRAIPGSHKYIATATGHHSQAFGTLVMIDPRIEDDEQMLMVKRITPDVGFPENQVLINGSAIPTNYGEAWPLNENYYLCVYDPTSKVTPESPIRASHGIYLVDSFGNRELIYRDPDISSHNPIPLVSRPAPPVIPDGSVRVAEGQPAEATVGLIDVYNSIDPMPAGTQITALRIYQVLPLPVASWHAPHNIGLQLEGSNSINNARAVLGTVPVEADGSAFFTAPARKELFFQALDEDGMAVQTMRSGTHFMPGENTTCLGCHNSKVSAPPPSAGIPLAMQRAPSTIEPDVDGTNPFSYPRLVQPVLDDHCVSCHAQNPTTAPPLDSSHVNDPSSGWMNIPTTYYASYLSLTRDFGTWKYSGDTLTGSLSDPAQSKDVKSIPGKVGARASQLYTILQEGHYEVALSDEELHRIIVWLDSYSPFYGVYEPEGGQTQLNGGIAVPTLKQ